MSTGLTRFLDPLYGVMTPCPFEKSLIFTPEVQRLRNVRLCNISSLLVVGASEVTRFEHSLGVLRLVNEWAYAHPQIPIQEANDLRAAALLHDIQSGPFGHSIQYILEDNVMEGKFEHDHLHEGKEAKYHQDLHANASFAGIPFAAAQICGQRWPSVSSLIKGGGHSGALISGSIDLDNIDNVIRLAFHVGIAGRDDAELAILLARELDPTPSGLMIPANGIPRISRWQDIRRRLYELLLLDWAEFSAKAMLTRAFEDAVRFGFVGLDSWRLTDSELLQSLLTQSLGEAQGIKQLLRRLQLGDLFAPVVLGRSTKTELYKMISTTGTKRAIETEIRNTVYGKNSGRAILLHPIMDAKKTDRSVTVMLREDGRRVTLGTDSSAVLLGVFSSSAPSSQKELALLGHISKKALIARGFADLTPIADPMQPASPQERQLDLSL